MFTEEQKQRIHEYTEIVQRWIEEAGPFPDGVTSIDLRFRFERDIEIVVTGDRGAPDVSVQ